MIYNILQHSESGVFSVPPISLGPKGSPRQRGEKLFSTILCEIFTFLEEMWWSLNKGSLIFLIACLTSCQDTATPHSEVAGLSSQRRTSRDINTPAPVSCQLSQWSEWTGCFPCQEKKYRYRTLLRPAKFMGSICFGSLWDESACRPTETCAASQHCGKDFKCGETGRCIKPHLVCNGESDCSDGSDENNCENEDIESFCENVQPIPGSERAAQGYNVLTQEVKQLVYDPKYYGGQCEYIYNGEWRELKYDSACERLYYGDDEKYYRKPYNFHVYQFLAHADSGFSFEFYDDSRSLIDAIKKDKTREFGFVFQIGVAKVPILLQLGFSLSHGKGSLKNFTEYNTKNVGFIRAITKVQTARFRMRRENIVLDENLLQALMELPEHYNYGMYARFINDYGTHFMTSGTMGGIFEYILVVNKDEMERKDITAESVNSCFGLSAGLTYQKSKISASLGISYKDCESKGFLNTDDRSHKAVVEDVIPRIQGGDVGSSGGLLSSWNANLYRHWGRSLKYNPTIIDFELQPIHEILRRSNLENIETKRQNLKRALDDYLAEFNACHCGPCQNNAEPILLGNACVCQCAPGSEGPACEQTKRKGTKTNGSWSCWSPWTPCQSGTKRRTRQCDNPAPQNGGNWCVGKSVQTETC
ncbi:LOW QUALITY PROTEIN: complement component C8 alpha chain [Carettochelys insculpta]|uniref:LOW QUALITY PROTEIN: complement component C8 alpha chain n=1 Tax=Carettochelys insculpta TaxID=44489 RepID=UPI003EB97D10